MAGWVYNFRRREDWNSFLYSISRRISQRWFSFSRDSLHQRPSFTGEFHRCRCLRFRTQGGFYESDTVALRRNRLASLLLNPKAIRPCCSHLRGIRYSRSRLDSNRLRKVTCRRGFLRMHVDASNRCSYYWIACVS